MGPMAVHIISVGMRKVFKFGLYWNFSKNGDTNISASNGWSTILGYLM